MIQSTFPGIGVPKLEESYTLDQKFGGLHPISRLGQSPIDQIAEAREAYNMPKLDHQTKRGNGEGESILLLNIPLYQN